MKISKSILFVAVISAVFSCKKTDQTIEADPDPNPNPVADNYSSPKDFYSKNAVPVQTYTINALTGGNFTSPQGAIVTIAPNSFVTQGNVPVSGTVTIKFRDIYKKSDMLLSNIATSTYWGTPLKSGGEFFIKAMLNNSAVTLLPGKKITVSQPAALTGGLDTLNVQQPFVGLDTAGLGIGWFPAPADSVENAANAYVFSLYHFQFPADSGTWCNSDNASYFSAYTQTTLTLLPADTIASYKTDVF